MVTGYFGTVEGRDGVTPDTVMSVVVGTLEQ